MKKKSNNKKVRLKFNSLKNELFRELTEEELKKITGGALPILGPGEFSFSETRPDGGLFL